MSLRFMHVSICRQIISDVFRVGGHWPCMGQNEGWRKQPRVVVYAVADERTAKQVEEEGLLQVDTFST